MFSPGDMFFFCSRLHTWKMCYAVEALRHSAPLLRSLRAKNINIAWGKTTLFYLLVINQQRWNIVFRMDDLNVFFNQRNIWLKRRNVDKEDKDSVFWPRLSAEQDAEMLSSRLFVEEDECLLILKQEDKYVLSVYLPTVIPILYKRLAKYQLLALESTFSSTTPIFILRRNICWVQHLTLRNE